MVTKAAFCRKLRALQAPIARVERGPDDPGINQEHFQGAAGLNAQRHEPIRVTIEMRNQSGYQLTAQDIPDFNGDYCQWPTFRSIFVELVHSNNTLSATAKFNALSKHLIGNTALIIAGMQSCDENYEIAWNLVKATYEKTRLIKNALLEKLKRLKRLTEENIPSLRYIVTKLKLVSGQLAALDVNIESWNPILTFNSADLLDSETRRQWELRHVGGEALTVQQMFEFLEHRIASLQVLRNANRLASAVARRNPSNTTSKPAIRSVVGHASTSRQSSMGKCRHCKGYHLLKNCQKFMEMNPYPRAARANQIGVCRGCLSDSHLVSQCNIGICKYCTKNQRHHKLLCFDYGDLLKSNPDLIVGLMVQQPSGQGIPGNENSAIGETLASYTEHPITYISTR